jgi:hypothetical protein
MPETQRAPGTAVRRAIVRSSSSGRSPARSRAKPPNAALAAMARVKRAYSVAKTRPRTSWGTDTRRSWVENTHTVPPPIARIMAAKRAQPKLGSAARRDRPAPIARYERPIAIRIGRSSSPVSARARIGPRPEPTPMKV